MQRPSVYIWTFLTKYSIKIKIYFSTVLGLSLLKVACVLSAPVAFVKTLISLLHAYVAAQNLAIIDGIERANNRKTELAKKPE